MLRYLTNKKKRERKERNYDAVKAIYAQGQFTFPAEYLTCHQEADQTTKDKLLTAAQARRERRNTKRLLVTPRKDGE